MTNESLACATRRDARPDAALLTIVRYATLAPSSRNSQPWAFRVTDHALELFADRTRALPRVDPRDRELVISCGAALLHARLAVRYFGFRDEVELFPDRRNRDLLARLRLGNAYRPTAGERALFDAMPRRRTYRFPFEPRPVPQPVIAELHDAAAEEDAWLQVLDGEAVRHSVASLIAQADRIQMADPELRRELAAWTRRNTSAAQDGVPGYALGFGALKAVAGPLVLRALDRGKAQAAKDRDLALGSPMLAVLGSFADSRYDWLVTGQALARVLLQARVADVFASFLNQPIEVPALRTQVQQIIGAHQFPQLLLRMGYATGEARAMPRRPVEDVLMDAGSPA